MAYELTPADRVWNRASLEGGGPCPRTGDLWLARLLSVHNLAMNGGVLHALESHDAAAIDLALQGLTYYGLGEVRSAYEGARQALSSEPPPQDMDALEQELDALDYDLVDFDRTIFEAFAARFLLHPDDFAPLE